MGLFDVDYNNGIWTNIPVLLRGTVMFAWVKCLVAPCKYVHANVMSFRNNILYRLRHTGQVYSLEAALNDVFDPVSRRITITDGPYKEALYLYLDAEEEPVYLYLDSENEPVYMYTDAESAGYCVQFIVNVPEAVTALPGYSLAWINSVVDEYRLPSKSNYSVVFF